MILLLSVESAPTSSTVAPLPFHILEAMTLDTPVALPVILPYLKQSPFIPVSANLVIQPALVTPRRKK